MNERRQGTLHLHSEIKNLLWKMGAGAVVRAKIKVVERQGKEMRQLLLSKSLWERADVFKRNYVRSFAM